MKKYKAGLILSLVLVLSACGSDDPGTSRQDQNSALAIGDTAPDFTLRGTPVVDLPDQREFSLYGSLENGPVLLAFYPMAFTGG
ncbi:hypothetical protein ACFL6G_03850 [candidate division KSB1 bacterium]